MDESHGPQSLQRSSNTWIRSYPYSCILLTRNWESCKIYCNSREPLLRITGWFAGENMRQECSVAGMNWGMLILYVSCLSMVSRPRNGNRDKSGVSLQCFGPCRQPPGTGGKS